MADQSPDEPIESRQTITLVITAVFLAASTVFVTLRFISRIGIVKRLQLDDYFIIAAWIVSFGLSFAVCYGTSVGLGRHEVDVPPAWNAPLKKAEYAFSVLYVGFVLRRLDGLSLTSVQNPALMLTKTSILIFYLRLSAIDMTFRWACWSTMAVVNLGGLALTILNTAQCSPVHAAFKTPVPDDANCIDIVTLYLSSAPLNVITDLAILFLPFPILTQLRLPRKQKIILLITFGFGVFVTVVDVVRIAYLQQAFQNRIAEVQRGTDHSDSRNHTDFSWYGSISYMWSAIEVHTGIMVACVPSLKPLVAKLLPNMLKDTDDDFSTRRASDGSRLKSTAEVQDDQQVPSVINSPARLLSHQQQSDRSRSEVDEDAQMTFMDFLTTPEMTELPSGNPVEPRSPTMDRMRRETTNTSRHGTLSQPTFFDFVNVHKRKSLVHMTNRESIWPIAMVTILFFIWGFAYGLLDTLNGQFQRVAHMSSGQSIGIHSAYFAGYLVAPPTFGRIVLKVWGFKACFIMGLAIYACGTLVFWPAAVLTSFPAFLVSNFIVGLGLSTLEIAANPFICLCGPQQYMEARLNISQGVQACASVVAPLLASKVLFKKATNSGALTEVQWTYLGIALFTVLLAVAYFYIPLPEVSDAELDDVAERANNAHLADIHIPFAGGTTVKIVTVTLILGIFAEWCYVGAQEAVSTTFSLYLNDINRNLDAIDFQAIGHATFALSRFIGAGLSVWIKARYLLVFFSTGSIAFSAICLSTRDPTIGATAVIMVYFFEGPIFGLIYAMCLR